MENTKRVEQEFALDTGYSNKNNVSDHPKVIRLLTFNEYLQEFEKILNKGGPDYDDYQYLTTICNDLLDMNLSLKQENELYELMKPLLTPDCLIGFSYLKPYGYTGDFEIIDRMYQKWRSSKSEELQKWDDYFHSFHSVRAVRNRKKYFINELSKLRDNKEKSQVLDIASGPCTDIKEFFESHPINSMKFDCLDMDKNAIQYASAKCKQYKDSINFINKNALRFKTEKKYDLIWSAGLFDYFNDKVFKSLLEKLYGHLDSDGELIIGNFADHNPSRGVMEILGKWFMHHRSADKLIRLALEIGVPENKIRVGAEETNVNLFLHIKK